MRIRSIPRRYVAAVWGGAVVDLRGGCQSFGWSCGRGARRCLVDGDRGIVVHPQSAPGVDRWTETAHEAPGRRRTVPARNLAKRESGDAGRGMIADRRAKQPRGRAAKPAVAAEHQDLCGGLVDDREWIALAVVGCDHPARKLDHRAGDLLVLRKLVDGGDRRGGSRAEARERQRQRTKKGPDRGVCAQATNRAALDRKRKRLNSRH